MRDLIIYLIGINVVTFFIYGIDKWKARRGKWRIPEDTLIWLAIAGGSIGALLGMYLFRHKTQHKKFTLGVPAIILVQAVKSRTAAAQRNDNFCISVYHG